MLLLTLIVISDMILCFLNFVSFSLDKCHIYMAFVKGKADEIEKTEYHI